MITAVAMRILSFRHCPAAQSWLKAGHTRERSSVDGPNLSFPTTRERNELSPERDDVQLRHTRRLDNGLWS